MIERARPLGHPALIGTAQHINAKNRSINIDMWGMRQPTTTKCAHCQWTYEGTAEQGKTAHKTHRQTAHGITGPHRRYHHQNKPRRFSYSQTNVHDNIANTRAQGGAQWASETDE